jgi:hypothetical protein
MNPLEIFIISFFLTFTVKAYDMVAEKELIDDLLYNYSKITRPNKLVSGGFNWLLKQIEAVDEKNQVMVSSSYFAEYWNDSRLSWNPTNHDNITMILVPVY